MKYFTSEWWGNGCEDVSVFEKYEAYLSSIRPRLPAPLVIFEAEYTLHDSEVKRIASNFLERKVVMELRGWDRKLEHPMYYKLMFSGVSEFEQQLPKQDFVEEELGDLGYWECELLDSGIEIRMLFASSAEFRIVFKDFDFVCEAI